MNVLRFIYPLVFLIPLFTSVKSLGFLDGPETLFFFYFCGISFLVFLSYSFSLFFQREVIVNIDIIDVTVFITFLYVALKIVVDPEISFTNHYFIIFSLLIAHFYLLRNCIFAKGEPVIRKGLSCCILAGLFSQVCLGVLQLFEVVAPASVLFVLGGSFGNPGIYAVFLAIMLPYTLSCFYYYSKKSTSNYLIKYFSLITFISIILILPFTNSRAAWVGGFIGIVPILYYRYKIQYVKLFAFLRHPVRVVFLVILSLFLMVCLFNFKKDSALGRVFIWSNTLSIIGNNMLWGVGFDSFKGHYNHVQAEYFSKNPMSSNVENAGDILYAFNEPLQLISELGLAGAAIFGSTLGLILLLGHSKLMKAAISGAFGSSVSVMVISLFAYPFHIVQIAINFMLMCVIMSRKLKSLMHFTIHRTMAISLSFVVFMCTLLFLAHTIKVFQGYNSWSRASHYSKTLNEGAVISEYNRTDQILSYNEFFSYNFGCQLSEMKKYKKSTLILESLKTKLPSPELYMFLGNNYFAMGRIRLAEVNYRYASLITPNRFMPKYLLANFYKAIGKEKELLRVANEITRMSVKIPSLEISQIKWEMDNIIQLHKDE